MAKPVLDGFAVVTATTDYDRAHDCHQSWRDRAIYRWLDYVVVNGAGKAQGYLGVVPAFAQGVTQALADGAQIICCIHDDLLIEEDGWDGLVCAWFEGHPACGLVGFGGGTGLGDSDIYETPYAPYQLARQGFCSNMRDAEAHGRRELTPVRVACLDGFSQIGTRAYWQGWANTTHAQQLAGSNLFQSLADLGMVHHAYDAALGCYAKRLGWEAWMLPIRCHHFGGRTAVADQGYHAWAEGINPGGDRTFWEIAHKIVYDEFRDVLPIRTTP